ncbi:NACHT domain- and WD repeat-containing protein 1-like [Stylophora pistillata]|uniref:NACHT domain- and WD repeat-containing protein 1-like n=1 Tax=Stylophora pistillata TaxID=50429 RepID=UPI000C0483AB|nr:NACHT domain- and WD repeat-containing protein 1-like [Stylophora pistillata]
MGVLLSKKQTKTRQSFQVNVAPQDADHKGEEAADHKGEEAAGPSNREDHSGKRRNEDDDTESQKSSESEQRPKSDDDDSDNDEKNKSDSEKEESVSEDNEDKKSRGSSSASSKKSKSSQEDEEKEERVEETKNKDVEVKEGGVKDVVLAQNEVNLSYEKKVEKALVGDMDFEYPEKAKIVRIFTSSTFTDTSVERNTLMERVYPRLKSYCQERGYDFQVVDMRWGVRDESTDDHMTTELCMRELRACQKLSTGPNFITFLGQKYGYRPFPVKIHVAEFEKLLNAVDKQDDAALLKHWFWRDDNSVPAQYLLQPITSLLPHYRDYANEESRKKASAEWWTAFERMQVILRVAADKALDNEAERHKYYMSVTEDEIRRGIINATGKDNHCFWFRRVITDISDFVTDPNTGKFVDKRWGNPSSVDESAQTLLEELREKDLPEVLSKNNIIQYDVKWHTNGIDPSASQEHAQYIKKLCTDFYDTLTDRINRGIEEDQSTNKEDILTEEVFQHGSFCRKKCGMFQGRDEFLTEVKDTILGERIAVLHGESGSGKTSLMAKVAMDVKKWLGGESATVVTRFIGTTPDSSNARSLLHSICQQISKTNEDSQGATVPQDMRSLMEFFPKCLEENASSKPIILVLDSLDQLSDDDGGRELDWVPKEMPNNVFLILSTLPGEKYICFPKLQEKYEASVLLEVPKMPVDTAKQILNNWFKSSGRQLQKEQEEIVLEAFAKCPLPLYLKLCFDEACRWKSYTTPSETKLTPSIKGIIHDLLDRVERLHGKVLVSQALAYITASRNGLTEPELEDILSLDDMVLNDVYQYWTPPIRRLPPLLWIRIRSDIGDYLIERGADGARVINWYHRQFIEVARERYLGDDQAVSIYSNLSEYFLGDWSDGVKKSYVDKGGKKMAMDRLVPKQPLMFDVSEDKPIFNLRKLSELPHHLLHSKQIEKLKQDTLCNFEFLLAKVQGSSVESVLQDFNTALTLYPDDREFDLLQKCLSLSAHALRQDSRQLPVQLIGRLYKYMHKQEFPYLKKVLVAAHAPSVPAFIPSQQCVTPAGGSLINSLSNEEFHGGIEYVNFTIDSKTIVTCNRGSEGLCLLYLDAKSGRRQRKVCFDSSETDVNACWCAKISKNNDDIFIASGSSANMYLINARTNKILQEYKPMKDQGNWFRRFPSVAFTGNDELIVALGDSSVRIWETASGKLLHDIIVKGINVEEEFGSLDANGELAVYCVRNTKTVHVLNVKTGEEVRSINVVLDKEEIRGEMEDTKVKEIHLTSRKQLLVVSEAYVKSQLKVYNAETGDYVLDLKDFGIGYSNRLIVSEDGRNATAIRNNYELVKWDLHTGEPTIVARLQPAFGTYGRN